MATETEHRPRTSLTKTDLKSSAGLELLQVLQTVADDGQLTRDECDQLHAWLDEHANVELAATGHLKMVVEEILKDGIVTDDELGLLHDAVLRVLPVDLRSIATFRRREQKAAARDAARQRKEEEKSRQREERERNAPLARADFMVAGVSFNNRQDACELCEVGDAVVLEREPTNEYDPNAILILHDGDELGYVPREEAEFYAELMDEGAKQSFTIKKLIETSSGRIIPVVYGAFYRPDADQLEESTPTPPSVPLVPSPAAYSPSLDATVQGAPRPQVDHDAIEATSAVSAAFSTPTREALKIAPADKYRPSALRGLLWVFLMVLVLLWVLAIAFSP